MTAKTLRTWCAALALLVVPAAAGADVVMEWNEHAMNTIAEARQSPIVSTRTMALVHVAMFDAMNAVEKRYTPYKIEVSVPAGSSSDAAGVAAAYTVLHEVFPEQAEALTSAYTTSLANIPEGAGKESGIALGEEVAKELLALRADDGLDAPNVYRPATAPSVYIPTSMPVATTWGQLKTWILDSGTQVRPPGPPELTSEQWARDYNETKDLGYRRSGKRTREQTDVGRFWAITGPVSWNPVVRQLAAAPGRTPIQNARLFALGSMVTADAYIAIFDAKYTYNFWRPLTSIRNGDMDGNDATEREPSWEPLIDTPMHPEYPCAHCISSQACATVLQSEFGTGTVPAVSMTSPTAPGVTRTWTNIQDYADEVAMARIYGGIHYRTSNERAQEMGRKIGEMAINGYLKPIER